MKAIAVLDRNWAIGRDGKLLCHIPGDLKYFKEQTLGKTLVMGRKTLESLPGGSPLPGRENVIISRTLPESDEYIVKRSVEEVLEYCRGKDVFIAGGETVYRQFLDYCDEFLITHIDEEFDADAYFPNLAELGMKKVWESEEYEEKGHKYRFAKYTR